MTQRPIQETKPAVAFTGKAAVMMRRAVTAVVFVIAGLTFCFGFGNGYAVGMMLGVPGWIAPLVAPAIDLSVVALLASIQYLRANGADGHLAAPRLLLLFSGVATLAMNTAHPIIIGEYGQACFYAVAPLLLIGWSEVGPRLLASLHGTTAGPSAVVPDGQGRRGRRASQQGSTARHGAPPGPRPSDHAGQVARCFEGVERRSQ